MFGFAAATWECLQRAQRHGHHHHLRQAIWLQYFVRLTKWHGLRRHSVSKSKGLASVSNRLGTDPQATDAPPHNAASRQRIMRAVYVASHDQDQLDCRGKLARGDM